MRLGDPITKRTLDRFERFKIIFPILLAGWIPSILTLIVSYTILRDTLESRILRDRQTLIQLVGHLVGHDLNRSRSVIEYYQTLPDTARVLSAANAQLAQQGVNSAFYSHPQIDGMFITMPDGTLLASIPTAPELTAPSTGANKQQRPPEFMSRRSTLVCRTIDRSPTSSARCARRTGASWAMLEFPSLWKELAAACPRLNFRIGSFLRCSIKMATRFLPAISNRTRQQLHRRKIAN